MSCPSLEERFGPYFSKTRLLMSAEEQELTSIVYDLSIEELSHSPEFNNESNKDLIDNSDDRFEISRENLERIVKHFEDAKKTREKFLKNFQYWELLRKENIRQLKEIADMIQDEKKRCGVGFLVGGAASIIGGAAITGAILFPPAAPALLPAAVSAYLPAALFPAATAAAAYLPAFLLPAAAAAPAAASGAMAGGLAAAGLGGATMAGSAVARVTLLQKRLEEAKEVVEADHLAFQYVEEWFRHTQGLIEATEALIGFDIMESWMKDLNTSLSWFKDWDKPGNRRLDLFRAAMKLCIMRVLPHLGMALPGFSVTFLASLLTFLFCLFWVVHRGVFDLFARTRAMAGRLRALDPSQLVQGTLAAGQVLLLMSRRGAVLGAFAGVGLLSSVAATVLSAIDLKEGADCKQAFPVVKVAEKLQEEYDILEELYNNLVCFES